MCHQRRDFFFVRQRIDPCEFGIKRFAPGGFHTRFVHETAVEVGDLLLVRICMLLYFRSVLNQNAQLRLRIVVELGKRAVHRFVGRDFGLIQPPAIHVPVEVVLRVHTFVHRASVDAGNQRRRRHGGGPVSSRLRRAGTTGNHDDADNTE